MFKNTAGQKWAVFAFDITDNTPKTGDAANITANVRIDGGAANAVDDVNPTEQEDGYYIFDIATAETNGDYIQLLPQSSTANIQVIGVPAAVFTRPPSFNDLGIESNGNLTAVESAGAVAGSVGSVTGDVQGNVDGTVTGKTPAEAGDQMALQDNAITSAKHDESTSYPIKSADVGSTQIARKGADSDTLETLSDQLDAILSLLDDARSEPGQGAPPENADAVTKIDYLYKFLINKVNTTASEIQVRDFGDTQDDHKSDISDDNVTFIRGKFGTGA